VTTRNSWPLSAIHGLRGTKAPAQWPAPAKINLFLHVVGRRPDGYHLLQTVFQFLELADALTIEARRDGQIRRVGENEGVAPEADLVVCAAQLLQRESGSNLGADIGVTKRIPLGSGLGGGSSDAASTLIALNELWDLNWPRQRLAELALQLGADVPVFVAGHAAFAEGVGEKLTPVELPETPILLLWPRVHAATASVFQHLKLTAFTPPLTIRDFRAPGLRNDLEEAACALYPQIGKALTWLRKFGPARMTGSGSCVFLPLADGPAGQQLAQRLIAELPPDLGDAWLTRAVNRHPLVAH
jgi:4-diphosphocytidyl-2-C-methyl-D-erythritol kinase